MDRHGITGAVFSGLTILVMVIAIYFLWESPLVLTVLAAGISLLTVRGKEDVSIYAVFFLTTLIVEPLMVSRGVWSYGLPSYLGTPAWIPFFWGVIGVAVKDLVFAVEEWYES